MDARAPTTGPAEVAKVGAALNGLADRIDEVIAVEREAVADLSHRLRTPLTALRLQVEALPDRESAEELNTQVTSLERTLTAVISAARRPQREGRVPHCDAVEVTRNRAAFWEPLFEDQGRELALDLPDAAGDGPLVGRGPRRRARRAGRERRRPHARRHPGADHADPRDARRTHRRRRQRPRHPARRRRARPQRPRLYRPRARHRPPLRRSRRRQPHHPPQRGRADPRRQGGS